MSGVALCWVCGEHAKQRHHIVTRQRLRREANRTGANYTKLAADERNLIACCLSCHAAHHNRTRPISSKALPDDAIRFASDLMGPGPACNYFLRYYAGANDDPRVTALHEIWGEVA